LLEIFLQLDVGLDALMFLILAMILASFIQLGVRIKNNSEGFFFLSEMVCFLVCDQSLTY